MNIKIRAAALLAAAVMLCGSVAAAAYSTLQYRDSGSDVLKLQQALNKLGYSTGGADGKFGPATENAVRSFQSKHGLAVDGKAGNVTQTLVYQLVGSSADSSSAAPANSGLLFGGDYATIEYGMSGSRVKTLQKSLNDLGYGKLAVDGRFGGGTLNAVEAFQKANKLTQDGKAGKKTLQKIESLTKTASGSPAADKPTGESSPAASTQIPSRTLRAGCKGDDVLSLQKRLKELGWYTGSLDGSYGNSTQAAVTAFQTAAKLSVDGVAGSKTYAKLYASNAPTAVSAAPSTSWTVPDRTLRLGYTGSDVLTVQKRLKELDWYDGSLDSTYSAAVADAVRSFQGACGLGADGAAGPKTYAKLFSTSAPSYSASSTSAGPSKSQVKLLKWYTEVKPKLSYGKTILIYDPDTRLSWTLRVLSPGRHADAEPLTLKDTQTMVKAFGNVNTWTQKPVYVRLPDGTWTVGSTHDMPHESGSITTNGFDGHLCVHFLRQMSEAEQNDPKYGVSNQKTIRTFWKSLTGEDINY